MALGLPFMDLIVIPGQRHIGGLAPVEWTFGCFPAHTTAHKVAASNMAINTRIRPENRAPTKRSSRGRSNPQASWPG